MAAKQIQKFPRYQTDTRAKIRLLGGPDWTDVRLINISKSGACVVSPVPFNESAIIEIIVASPNPEIRMHNFMARIVWSEGQRFGIQFMSRL